MANANKWDIKYNATEISATLYYHVKFFIIITHNIAYIHSKCSCHFNFFESLDISRRPINYATHFHYFKILNFLVSMNYMLITELCSPTQSLKVRKIASRSIWSTKHWYDFMTAVWALNSVETGGHNSRSEYKISLFKLAILWMKTFCKPLFFWFCGFFVKCSDILCFQQNMFWLLKFICEISFFVIAF